ncbi:MAG: fused MFS/spermidine synthase [Sedimentisphaerales bacterium]|nr:fused MFS/spermidine synthase [Sedimentisphaerales bacterium]
MEQSNNKLIITRSASVNCIMLVYFVSGACSLIDEVVWVRLLKLTLGNTVYATSIVVSVFMAGLALGALIMGRFCDRVRIRLRLYALLEVLITISALALPWALKLADTAYVWFYRTYEPSQTQLLIVQVIISAIILLIPTILMGSTLPLLGRFVTALEREAGHLVGKLYALNTLGAAAGCFLAGFVLIKSFGVMGTLYIAASLNLLVALGGWLLYRFSGVSAEQEDSATTAMPGAAENKTADGRFYLLVIAFFASGLISIGYELLWMRSIIHLLGGATYVFSAVLTIYLLGNVIGAGIGSRLVKRLKSPAAGFAVTLSLLGLCGIFYLPLLVFWTSKILPTVNTAAEAINNLVPVSPYMINPLVQSVLLFTVPAVIMGIGFPIALQAWANHTHKVGRSTGMAYGANTIGAVSGGIMTGFVLIPLLGLQLSITILGLAGVWIAGAMWLLFAGDSGTAKRWALLGAAAALTILTAATPSNLFNVVVGASPRIRGKDYSLVFVKEGLTTTVSLHRGLSDGALHMYSSGQSVAGDNYVERGDQKMLGHLSVLLNSGASDVLSVGFGSGETTACLSQHNLRRIDCVEIAPEVVDVALKFYEHINLGDDLDSKVNMIFMDAKNYLHLTDSRYDVIINDSIHPRDFAENASLYTEEYFRSARRRLNKNGMIISWLPTYDMSISVFNSVIGTLMDVFPHVTIWHLTPHPAPLVLVAASEQQQYFSPKYIDEVLLDENIRSSLLKLNIQNNMDVLSCYIGDENDLRKAITNFSINSDYFPYVEFAADAKLPKEQIFSEFVLRIRSNSVASHIDWTGFDERKKTAWLADYQKLYEACSYILMSESTTNILEKLRYSLAGLKILPDKPAILAARTTAEKTALPASVNMVLSGQADSALTLSLKMLEIYPQSSVAFMIKAIAMQYKGNMQEAMAAGRQAVELAPDNPDMHFGLGIILSGAGQIEQAITEYQEAVRLSEQASSWERAKMLSTLSSAYAAAGRPADAINAAEKALNIALSAGQQELAESIRKQLISLYRKGR